MTRLAALFLAAVLSPVVCAAERVLVFTTQARPVDTAGTAAEVYLLDGVALLEDDFSQGLPDDPVAAEQALRARLGSPEGQAWAQRVQAAAVGPAMAWQLGVRQLPAVLFQSGEGGEFYAVYGAARVDVARQLWQHWQAQAALSQTGGAP